MTDDVTAAPGHNKWWQTDGDAAVAAIKDALDAKFNGPWHVVVGKHYGSKDVHEAPAVTGTERQPVTPKVVVVAVDLLCGLRVGEHAIRLLTWSRGR